MKSLLLSLLFCLGFFSGTSAQNRSFGTLPMAQKSKARILGTSLKDTPEYQKALEFRYPIEFDLESTAGGQGPGMTGPNYKKATARGIKLKANRAAITKTYGEPDRTLETPLGQIMVYDAILFMLGKDGLLERWVNYL